MSKKLDNPENNDNRRYDYSTEDYYYRAEFSIIENFINDNSCVIDLGCGNGSLMKYLAERKKIKIEGIEISPSGVNQCLKNNLSARLGEIDDSQTYNNYVDDQFDFAVCNVTLQMVMFPEILLQQMFRVSKKVIISFPNFAYLGNRLDLLFNGVMPRPMLYKYHWYNTGHIHQLSLKDFENYCKNNSIKILKKDHLGCFGWLAKRILPNVFSKVTVFLCEKRDSIQ